MKDLRIIFGYATLGAQAFLEAAGAFAIVVWKLYFRMFYRLFVLRASLAVTSVFYAMFWGWLWLKNTFLN